MEVLVTITRIITVTEKNTVISPNFLVWKFHGRAQFPHSFERITRNYAETLFPQNFQTMNLDEITVFFSVNNNDDFETE